MTCPLAGPSYPLAFGRFWLRFLILTLLIVALASCGGTSTGSPAGSGAGSGGTGGGTGGGGGAGNSAGPFTAGRSKYVRTDAATEYFQSVNPHWIIYNPPTNRFFVADPSSGHVMVLDASSQMNIGQIVVPGAYSLEDSPDQKTLYVGSVMGDLYTIDPVAISVTSRHLATQIGPSGFSSEVPLVMADGRIALLGGTGGIGLNDSSVFALWKPTDNSVNTYSCNSFFGNAGSFWRTPDRTKFLLGSYNGMICEMDETTGQIISGVGTGLASVNFRVTPDGKYIVVPTNTLTPPPNQYAAVYDLATLNLVSQFPVSGDTSSASGFAISADSKTVFVPNAWIIYAYDIASGKQTGWLPNINVPVITSGMAWGPVSGPNLQAVDGTGLIAGPMEEGVGFIDTTVFRTGTVGSRFPNGYLKPATGPVSGGTQTQITEPASFNTLSAVYFGSNAAMNASGVSGPDTYGQYGSVSAMSPSGKTGPSDVFVFTKDGGIQFLPEGFNYGPTVLQITPNMSTSEGGGSGVIYGYGFGPVGSAIEGPLPQVSHLTLPSSLTVSVGGSPAQVTGFAPYAFLLQSPPLPLQALAYTIPPGSAGADVTVTSASGSVTVRGAMNYLPAVQQFPLPSAALVQGIYDPHRDLYYFTDANKIQVFSRTQATWLSPISITSPTGTTERLWGIALSPDGTKLAVSDISAGAVYLLNPSSPGTVKTLAVNAQNVGFLDPCGLAVSDAGMVYYAVVWHGISGGRSFYKVDSSDGSITNYGIAGPGTTQDPYLRVLISSDNKRVFFNDDGYVFYVDTSDDSLHNASIYTECCYGDYELTIAGNGSRLEGSSYLYDSDLNGESFYSLNDREVMNISYVYGAKLSADGSLLFQPSTNGIDVFDGRLGVLLNRVSLPITLSPNDDALVSDGSDNVLLAITGTNGDGIAVLDLTSVASPPPLPYATKILPHPRGEMNLVTEPPKLLKNTSSPDLTKPGLSLVPRIQHLTTETSTHFFTPLVPR